MFEREIRELTELYMQILALLLQSSAYPATPVQKTEDKAKTVKRVNLSDLKQLALNDLPSNSSLRDLILAEKEELPVQEFLAKLDILLKLLNKEIP